MGNLPYPKIPPNTLQERKNVKIHRQRIRIVFGIIIKVMDKACKNLDSIFV
jgi:hypothetical protein